VNQLWNKGKGIFIWDRPLVEVSIVLDRSELPVLLFNEEEATGIR
jgi:hypothetical protein